MNSTVTSTGPLVEEQAAARAQSFSREEWIFLAIAAIITILRTYSRWSMVGWRRFQADDVLVWLALGLFAATTVIDVQLIGRYKGLANDFTNADERASLSPDSEEYQLRVGASKLRLIEWPIYTLLLWSLKAAMAIFYMRLMETLTGYLRRIQFFFALMLTMFIIVVSMPFLVCIPISKMWQITPDPGPLCYPESSPAVLWTILACNIITDAYLLWLPIPMLKHAVLPRGTKIALGCLFGCGLFVTVAATLRITLVATRVHDFHAIAFWSVRETFVAIATTNLPAIFVLVRRWLKSPFATFATRRSDNNNNNNNNSSSTRYGTIKRYLKGWRSPPPGLPEKSSPSETFASQVSSERKSQISVKNSQGFQMRRVGSITSDRELILSPMPSVHDTLTHSRRRSEDSVLFSPGGTRVASQRRGSNGRNALVDKPLPPIGGIRKEVEIMVVEEALHELGADPRLSTSYFTRSAPDNDRMPSVPGPVHTYSPC
ncbi:hypothetical protein N0V93_000175 [Gnomoniopsis smithogilvyi]|uniref:Rhodopsin domain-containing protein n=1 Tax=Gnomoniopsis smithogilvyi TaxID=1191159 RepID=A0A9W9D151_9PEZI|nr:hypothetical protein N0V93_000175 [Gnomoniopsis smithogilvyi]